MKYFIFSPANSITGGAENLHQIGHALNKAGERAYITYYPEETGGRSKEFFKNYNMELKQPLDREDEIIIIPELNTNIASDFKKSKIVISWLSVDNYFQKKRQRPVYDEYISLKRLLKGQRLSFNKMRFFHHITQSNYAEKYLLKMNIESIFIGDYINQDFVENKNKAKTLNKEDFVLYNPKKGQKYNDFVIKSNPHINFKPLVNYTRKEMIKLLQTSKVYMDLGHHPGKDRIPREAAISGCCVITSKAGSAGNDIDLPIGDNNKFKLSKKSLAKLGNKIDDIFNNYDKKYKEYSNYVNTISNEKKEFFHNINLFSEQYG
jgi:hypothetical protein